MTLVTAGAATWVNSQGSVLPSRSRPSPAHILGRTRTRPSSCWAASPTSSCRRPTQTDTAPSSASRTSLPCVPPPPLSHPSLTSPQHATARLFDLSVATLSDPAQLAEAQRLQGIVARGDFTIAKASIAGTKFLLEKLYGYGGLPRKPLPPINPDVAAALWAHPHVQELVAAERELSGKRAQ